MGKKERQWQDVDYVLGFFGRKVGEARKGYESYVKKGIPRQCGGGTQKTYG